MSKKTRRAMKKWMEFQLASVDAARLIEKLDHAVFIGAVSYEDMQHSDLALERLGNARFHVVDSARLNRRRSN